MRKNIDPTKMAVSIIGLLLCLAFLFAGCVVVQAPVGSSAQAGQEAQQNDVAQNPAANTELTGAGAPPSDGAGSQPQQGQDAGITCSLTLTPGTIYSGSSTDIGYSVYSEGSTVFTFNCGDETAEISSGGSTSGSKLCEFSGEGAVKVQIKADGAVCAEKELIVLRKTGERACSIDTASMERDLDAYFYKATVNFQYVESGDYLTWVCDYTTAKKQIVGDTELGMPAREIISCDFSERPRKESIEVFLGTVKCGEIPTR